VTAGVDENGKGSIVKFVRRRQWTTRAVALAFLVTIVVVANPELRAFLLLADALGLEMLLLLLATQWGVVAHALQLAAHSGIRALCAVAFSLGTGAVWAYPRALPWRPFDKVFCPALVVASLAKHQLVWKIRIPCSKHIQFPHGPSRGPHPQPPTSD
jgi:hypothetical protein